MTDAEKAVLTKLDGLGIAYETVEHAPAATIDLCKDIEKTLACPIPKNLFLTNAQHRNFYLLVMPGDKPFKTKYLSKQIGSSRLSFGTGEEMEALLGCSPGSASVFGVMNDKEKRVALLIDRDVLQNEALGFHPCLNTATVKLGTDDLITILLPALGVTPTFVDLKWETE